MALILWSNRFATGILAVDDQHKTLFQTINDLHDGLMAGHAKERIGQTIQFLVDYTSTHFKAEEAFMELHRFDGLPAHRAEHVKLIQDVAAFKEQYTRNPDNVRPMEMAKFLGDWLTHHILQIDFQYVKFLKDKGITV